MSVTMSSSEHSFDPSFGRVDLWIKKDSSGTIYFGKRDDVDVNNKNKIVRVTLPFFYWKSQDPFGKITDKTDVKVPIKKPDVTGRISIKLTPQDCSPPEGRTPYEGEETNWRFIERACHRVKADIQKREGHTGMFFRFFIPLSTRTIGSTAKSLFPLTGRAFQYTEETNYKDDPITATQKFLITIAAIMDAITIPFRLLTLLPRIIYQHLLQNDESIENENIDVDCHKGKDVMNWGHGLLLVHGMELRSQLTTAGSHKTTSLDTSVNRKGYFVYLGS